MSTTLQILVAVISVSLISLVGVFLLSFKEAFLKKTLLYFVSFAVGALFANVFLHLLPETIEQAPDIHKAFIYVLVGILISFFIEKFVHWHHCHNLECHDYKPVGTLMLIGDGVHNLTDGILIASTFLVDPQLGIATTIAIILHEIPQEVGDFAVLLHSGWSRTQALLANFASALTAVVGAVLVLFLNEYVTGIEAVLLPITAGNFLYIAGSDLIPELHKESKLKNALLQFCAILAGILLMSVFISNHEHVDAPSSAEMHDHPHTDQEILKELQQLEE